MDWLWWHRGNNWLSGERGHMNIFMSFCNRLNIFTIFIPMEIRKFVAEYISAQLRVKEVTGELGAGEFHFSKKSPPLGYEASGP